ncbi:MAG: acyclic terpene utilization AtuA family protein [Isosphaeraceae bacterium]
MPTAAKSPIRIGNGAGFWGDSPDAPLAIARDGRLDVLTLEYLAELTMAILGHQRDRDPATGFVHDFPATLRTLAPMLLAQAGLKIVTNAGGLNPRACAVGCGKVLEEAGLGDLELAILRGDDVLLDLPRWRKRGVPLDHLETGEPFSVAADRLLSANVYLGARSIADALLADARIVLTGRVADASLTVGPAAAHFGWAWDDWERLAGASVAGHLIECGAQATGGLWHEWERLPDPAGIGYPIAEIAADGSCAITKPEGSGGLVSVGTVTEQLLYEIGDPSGYRTPDVDVDFTEVSLEQEGPDRVVVRGARGGPPSDHVKLVVVYSDGWTAGGLLGVVGQDAAAKARAAGEVLIERVRRAGFTLDDSRIECLGAGDVVPGVWRPERPPWEVVLRVSVRSRDRAAVERFCRELAPLITSGPPGLAGYAAGRPSPRPAFGYWPTLVPRSLVGSAVEISPARKWAAMPPVPRTDTSCPLSAS